MESSEVFLSFVSYEDKLDGRYLTDEMSGAVKTTSVILAGSIRL